MKCSQVPASRAGASARRHARPAGWRTRSAATAAATARTGGARLGTGLRRSIAVRLAIALAEGVGFTKRRAVAVRTEPTAVEGPRGGPLVHREFRNRSRRRLGVLLAGQRRANQRTMCQPPIDGPLFFGRSVGAGRTFAGRGRGNRSVSRRGVGGRGARGSGTDEDAAGQIGRGAIGGEGLLQWFLRHSCLFVVMLDVARGASRLSDRVIHNGHNRVVGYPPLARTVVIHQIAEPRRALLHARNSDFGSTVTASTSARRPVGPGHSYRRVQTDPAQKEAACRSPEDNNKTSTGATFFIARPGRPCLSTSAQPQECHRLRGPVPRGTAGPARPARPRPLRRFGRRPR